MSQSLFEIYFLSSKNKRSLQQNSICHLEMKRNNNKSGDILPSDFTRNKPVAVRCGEGRLLENTFRFRFPDGAMGRFSLAVDDHAHKDGSFQAQSPGARRILRQFPIDDFGRDIHDRGVVDPHSSNHMGRTRGLARASSCAGRFLGRCRLLRLQSRWLLHGRRRWSFRGRRRPFFRANLLDRNWYRLGCPDRFWERRRHRRGGHFGSRGLRERFGRSRSSGGWFNGPRPDKLHHPHRECLRDGSRLRRRPQEQKRETQCMSTYGNEDVGASHGYRAPSSGRSATTPK